MKSAILTTLLAVLCMPLVVLAHETDLKNAVIVHVTPGGFEPAEVTVPLGTTIYFENVGDSEHWPASDNHPSHTLFDGSDLQEHCQAGSPPTFDSCHGLTAGQSWGYTFTQEGTFTYHDHLWPHLTGTITVGEENVGWFRRFTNFIIKTNDRFMHTFFPLLIPATSPEPAKASAPQVILQKTYADLVAETDPRLAIETLKQDAASSSEIMSLCHEILHEIGRTAFYQYGSFSAASVYQDSFCNSGYLHGLFEEYFATTENVDADMKRLCHDFGTIPFDAWQCRHGVGHGFMYFTGGDLDASLKLCTDTFTEAEEVKHCQNGAYMEVFNTEVLAEESTFIDPDDIFATCTKRSQGQNDCYHYIPTYLSNAKGIDYLDMFAVCDTAPAGHVDDCKLGIGAEAMKRSMGDTDTVFLMCSELAQLRNQTICVTGAISMYVNQIGSHEEAESLCPTVPEAYRVTCQEIMKLRAPEFSA